MSRIFDQDFADDEPDVTKHPERLFERRVSKDRHMYGWDSYPIYALIMIVSGFLFAIAVFGG